MTAPRSRWSPSLSWVAAVTTVASDIDRQSEEDMDSSLLCDGRLSPRLPNVIATNSISFVATQPDVTI